jgi:hypothetical protein
MDLLVIVLSLIAPALNNDPFAFLRPSVTISSEDDRLLDRDKSVAHVLPAQEPELAVFAAVRVDVDGDRLVAWMRHIAELKKSEKVLAIGRFSDPPALEDLSGLLLDEGDLKEIVDCRPRDCGLKLSAYEMVRLQRVAAAAGTNWRPRVQEAFRAVVLERVKAFIADGHSALGPFVDHRDPVWPAARFASVLGHSLFLTANVPRFAEHLGQYPRSAAPAVESFVYWSKERLDGKAIVSATHVSIVRSAEPGLPDALVAGSQIFATHYMNASLGVTMILRGKAGAPAYLVYINRSEVDRLGGVFGGLVRRVIQRRLRSEAADILQGLRDRLESGAPPAIASRDSR